MIGSRACLLLNQYIRKFSSSCLLRSANKVDSMAVVSKIGTTEVPVAAKDVIIYKFESPRFFKFLNIFAIAQYGFWTFISYSSMSMVDIPVPQKKIDDEDLPFWRKLNLGSDKYKYGLAIGSAFMGFAILSISCTYILRSVRFLVLRKDGKSVSFVTYTPFGKNRIMDVPISNISAQGSRTSGSTQMPVRVKGKRMFYLIDLKEGKVIHPQLFDRTVGTKRRI